MSLRTFRWVLVVTCMVIAVGSATARAGNADAAPVMSASVIDEPAVAVAKDVTATCELTYTTNLGSVNAISTKRACPAGTIIQVSPIPLAEATAHHQAYVRLPSPAASTGGVARAEEQIQALIEATRAQTMQLAHQSNPLLNSPCGKNAQAFAAWVPDYNSKVAFAGFANYYHSQDCRQVVLQQTGIQQYYGLSANYWASERYNHGYLSDVTWPLYCRFIPQSGSTYTTYTIDTAYPSGGYFSMETSDSVWGGGCPYIGNFYDMSFGTLN
ncbi:MAG: hypothetical protein ACHQ4H_06500 [Ktedonobacterales bacterium]